MPLPKFSDLSGTVQIVIVLVVGAALWGVTEYLMLQPVRASNETKQQRVTTLEREVAPLRPFRERVRALEADNRQLENQLANLRRIVPNEKEVDNFVRLLQTEASTAGVLVRRITAQAPVTQQYYIEVPFELELDGSYYDVLQFYDRLGRVERITNVADLRLGGILSGGASGSRKYDFGANTTVAAVCKVTTFFSREEEPEPEPAPAPRGRAPARRPAPARAPAAAR
jgi:type IV pilus assembly protein PilO